MTSLTPPTCPQKLAKVCGFTLLTRQWVLLPLMVDAGGVVRFPSWVKASTEKACLEHLHPQRLLGPRSQGNLERARNPCVCVIGYVTRKNPASRKLKSYPECAKSPRRWHIFVTLKVLIPARRPCVYHSIQLSWKTTWTRAVNIHKRCGMGVVSFLVVFSDFVLSVHWVFVLYLS